jgi:hypothetical protein
MLAGDSYSSRRFYQMLFKSHDFMTLFVNEGCDYRTHLLMGLYLDLNLVSRQMYCALYEASDNSTSKADIDKQCCVGPEMSQDKYEQVRINFSHKPNS